MAAMDDQELHRLLRSKESACQCRRCRRPGFDSLLLGRYPGEGTPTPVFLPRKSQGQRSLAGYSP